MPETEAFHLRPPTDDDLAVAEAAWRSGEARCTLRTDDVWWRVLRAPSAEEAHRYATTGYPSPAPQRFTPIVKDAQIVPAAYAGSTRAVSLWEVILRNIRHEGIRRIPEREVRDRYLVSVTLCRPLRLFDVRRPHDTSLVMAGKRPPDLTAAWPAGYPITRAWAQALHARLPEIDGIIYESHQVSGHCAVFYRPPLDPLLFEITSDPHPVSREPVRTLLLKEARKARVAIDFGDDDADAILDEDADL
jgi:hypothetical protein